MTNVKTNPKILQFFNIMAFVLVIVVNTLSNALPLNGRTAGEISDALPSYFTPAGYTFSIWGLIYLALLGYTIYQAIPGQRERPYQQRIGWLFVASSLANAAWIFAWHFGFYALSVFLMIALLVSLIAIYTRLKIGLPGQAVAKTELAFVHVPFSLYLGWITVATIANIASVSAHLGWNGFGIAEPIWSVIMMSVAVVVAGLLLFNRRDFAYAGVLVWALFGIRAAQTAEPLVATVAVVTAVLITALAFIGYFRTRKTNGTLTPKMA
jgi:hypothetical protein